MIGTPWDCPQARKEPEIRPEPSAIGGLEGLCHLNGFGVLVVVANLGVVGSARSTRVKVNAHIHYRKDFRRHRMRHLRRERTVRRTRKTAVDILAVGHFPAKEEEAIDVDNGDGHHAAAGDFVQDAQRNHAPNDFNSIDLVAVKAAR